MQLPVLDIRSVAERGLCCGCGACAVLAPDRITMIDAKRSGRRPLVRGDEPVLGDAAKVCPGASVTRDGPLDPATIPSLRDAFGPVLKLYEGWATDKAVRWRGSSGGVATALGLHALERMNVHGVLHAGFREGEPLLNTTYLSRSRADIEARAGSRYAPASPCDGLDRIMEAPGSCLFVGKPCDVLAVQRTRRLRPELDAKLDVVVAFFCAGTPGTEGSEAMLAAMGMPTGSQLLSLHYRGEGWPGRARARWIDPSGKEGEGSLTYDQAWGEVLVPHKQWRCNLCVDHTGEFADIAVGDPWHSPPKDGNEVGRSLVLARTPAGLARLEAAVRDGYLHLEEVAPDCLPRAQRWLIAARGSVWGRTIALRTLGVAAPVHRGLPMFRFWRSELSFKAKVQSIFGTWRRIFTKGLRKRKPVEPWRGPAGR